MTEVGSRLVTCQVQQNFLNIHSNNGSILSLKALNYRKCILCSKRNCGTKSTPVSHPLTLIQPTAADLYIWLRDFKSGSGIILCSRAYQRITKRETHHTSPTPACLTNTFVLRNFNSERWTVKRSVEPSMVWGLVAAGLCGSLSEMRILGLDPTLPEPEALSGGEAWEFVF